jgi:general secretion pathway protein E
MNSASVRDGLAGPVPVLAGTETMDLALLSGFVASAFLRENRILPLSLTASCLRVAMTAPVDEGLVEALRMATGRAIEVEERLEADISASLQRLFSDGKTVLEKIVADLGPDAGDEDIDRLKDLASEAPVVRLVSHLIEEAIRSRASDIHIEPYPDRLAVRLRIDGVLRDQPSPPVSLARAVVSRIKILANLNIAERRLPQDGRVAQAILGHALDLRVSTVPTIHGESVVIRLLDQSAGIRPLAELGLRAEDEAEIGRLMALPNGILLVTGPTGSGKTTSLYTALQLIDAAERKVITIEDPVEYHMARVNQIQVKPQIGLTFATILRSIVRQDPDVIMVGEMRDAETADIAVHAALTGHLVLSTLHTNSAAGALIRLIDMGIEPFLLTSTVRAVIGQRLVRTLCPHCKRARPATNDEQMSFEPVPLVTLFQPIGCAACGQTGYLGRVGLFEVMTMSDELRSLTLARAGSEALERAARAAGMQSLLQDGLGKVRQGLTTLEEVRRVVDLS